MKMPYPTLLLFVPFDFYNYSLLSIFLATIARALTLLDWGSGDLTGSAQFCNYDPIFFLILFTKKQPKTRSRWLNCALRGEEAVYWVSIGQQ